MKIIDKEISPIMLKLFKNRTLILTLDSWAGVLKRGSSTSTILNPFNILKAESGKRLILAMPWFERLKYDICNNAKSSRPIIFADITPKINKIIATIDSALM